MRIPYITVRIENKKAVVVIKNKQKSCVIYTWHKSWYLFKLYPA